MQGVFFTFTKLGSIYTKQKRGGGAKAKKIKEQEKDTYIRINYKYQGNFSLTFLHSFGVNGP